MKKARVSLRMRREAHSILPFWYLSGLETWHCGRVFLGRFSAEEDMDDGDDDDMTDGGGDDAE